MTGSALPPDLGSRVSDLERQLRDLQRSQNPSSPKLFDLSDVSGQPTGDGQILTYHRADGVWKPGDAGTTPAGFVAWSASANAPAGNWLAADGGAVSRTTYAALFAEIGTVYGVGDGSTTFNVPNLDARMVIGAGVDALGGTGGARTHTLTTSEMPGHTHGISPVLFNGTTSHTHSGQGGKLAEGPNDGSSGTAAVTGSTGSGAAHNNLPPYIALWGWIHY